MTKEELITELNCIVNNNHSCELAQDGGVFSIVGKGAGVENDWHVSIRFPSSGSIIDYWASYNILTVNFSRVQLMVMELIEQYNEEAPLNKYIVCIKQYITTEVEIEARTQEEALNLVEGGQGKEKFGFVRGPRDPRKNWVVKVEK
jgi:hypothetical protein